jgi:hypothetical protein
MENYVSSVARRDGGLQHDEIQAKAAGEDARPIAL